MDLIAMLAMAVGAAAGLFGGYLLGQTRTEAALRDSPTAIRQLRDLFKNLDESRSNELKQTNEKWGTQVELGRRREQMLEGTLDRKNAQIFDLTRLLQASPPHTDQPLPSPVERSTPNGAATPERFRPREESLAVHSDNVEGDGSELRLEESG